MTIDTTNNTIITTNALIYKLENNEIFFLLVQENDGFWGLPGGAKELEDNNLLTTIKRELSEELGLGETDYVVKETGIQKEFEYNFIKSNRYGKKGIVKFFIVKINEPERATSSGEIKQAGWFNKEEASIKLTFNYIRDGFLEASNLI